MKTAIRLVVVSAATLFSIATLLALSTTPRTAFADDLLASVEKALSAATPGERVAGLALLDGTKPDTKAEKVVLKALGDPDWGVQIKACSVLRAVGGKASVDPLATLAVNGDIQWVRDAATLAVKSIAADDASTPLLDAAGRSTRDEVVRARGIDAAGAMVQKSSFGRLSAYAKSKEVVVAAASLRAVGRLGNDEDLRKDVMGILDGALDRRGDKKYYFAYVAAIEGLGVMKTVESRDRLIRELIEFPDEELHAQERIARALSLHPVDEVALAVRRGFAAAKKPDDLKRLARLVARLTLAPLRADVEQTLTNSDERVRSEAARALGKIADNASAPALTTLLDDTKANYARMEAVTALAKTLPFDGFIALATKLKADPNEIIRLQYVVELSDLGRPEAIATLAQFLGDKSWRVASAAAATVGTLGIGEDLPLLEPLVKDRNWKIRGAALEGMGRLRTAAAMPFLIDGLIDKDPVVRGVSHANLQILSAEKFPADVGQWRAWYEKTGSSLVLVKKSRRKDSVKPKNDPNDRYARTPEYAIEVLQKARILVVTGAWDHVEKVLDHLSVKHTLLRAQELKDKGLNPNQVILVNCEGNMDKDSTERVQWFVNVGGYLMTTDWALTKTIQIGFPGYAKQFSGSTTGNDVVVVEEAALSHPFTAGVFDNVPALQWWLEIQAFPMTIQWPERCEVIVDSAQMRQKYGSSPLACTFRWGLGKVQHSASHFYLQEEGMTQAKDAKSRMIFAADNLGISLEQIRKIAAEGGFDGQINEETMKKIAPDYSMFRLIVNVVREKSDFVENL